VVAGFRKPEVPRDQLVLWSARLDDAIPSDHPVRQVAYVLESEPFAATFREWEQSYVLLEGKPPYHPRDLTGLYVYGMMNRIRSSRQLEAACYNRVDVIWLMLGQHPDHSTISEFVARHGEQLRGLLRNTLEVGIRAGLVKLEHVSVDGSKQEADAGKGSVHRKVTIAAMLAKGVTPKQAGQVKARALMVIDICKAKSISALSPSASLRAGSALASPIPPSASTTAFR
jgi:transposase